MPPFTQHRSSRHQDGKHNLWNRPYQVKKSSLNKTNRLRFLKTSLISFWRNDFLNRHSLLCQPRNTLRILHVIMWSMGSRNHSILPYCWRNAIYFWQLSRLVWKNQKRQVSFSLESLDQSAKRLHWFHYKFTKERRPSKNECWRSVQPSMDSKMELRLEKA